MDYLNFYLDYLLDLDYYLYNGLEYYFYLGIAILALVTGVVGFSMFKALSERPQPEHVLYYQQPRVIEPFELVDQYNKPFTNKELKGKWTWVFLGYTSCPDICPTTMQELNYIYDDMKLIQKDAQKNTISITKSRTELKICVSKAKSHAENDSEVRFVVNPQKTVKNMEFRNYDI